MFGITSQKKRMRTNWICLQKDADSLKQDIAYLCIVVSTDLSMTCLPATKRNISYNPMTNVTDNNAMFPFPKSDREGLDTL